MAHDPQEPLQTLTYRVTRADALAWEVLPTALTGYRRLVFLIWLGLGGITMGLVPEEIVGPEGGWRFYAVLLAAIAVQYALVTAWMTGRRYWRARIRVPQPYSARLEIWGDHLAEYRDGQAVAAPRIVAPELVRQIVLTQDHLFLDSPPHVLILPASAFPDRADMSALAARWDELSAAAVP